MGQILYIELNKRLVALRKKVRANSKTIIDTIVKEHNAEICVFCGRTEDLTKEHVLPKWTFDDCPDKDFVTNINGISQTYIQTVVPACSECNSYLLGYFEKCLKQRLSDVDWDNEQFTEDDCNQIIRWLEIIEYKFHVLNLRRKFRKAKDSDYIPYLADFPIALLQGDASLSPSKVFSNLRNALKVISIKSKSNKQNSLLVFKTTNLGFHFFHKTNDYLFIELPKYGVAVFYFFNRKFKRQIQAYKAAMEIIKTVY